MIKLANAVHVYVRVWEEIATLIAILDSPDVIPIREMFRGHWTHFVLFCGFEEGERKHCEGCVDWNAPLISCLFCEKSTFKVCQDILSVSTTCFCDNREMRVHFHGINKNIVVIYRVGLNSKLGHNEALSVWTEIAATSILFPSHWDQHNHGLWLPRQSEVLVARGLEFSRGPPFWNSLFFLPQHIQDLQALRS